MDSPLDGGKVKAKHLTLAGRAQFRAWRMRREMTAGEVANRLGVRESTVHGWEAGHTRPSFDTAARIETLMSIPMRDWARARRR